MEDIMMGVALREEARFRNRIHDDWERDYARLERLSEANRRDQAIRGAVSRIVQFFRPVRPLEPVRA